MESATLEVTDEIIVQLDPNQARIADAYLRELARIIVLMGARGGGKSADLRAIILFAHVKKKLQTIYASQSTGNSLDQFNKITTNPTAQEFFLRDPQTEPFTTKPIPTIRWANGGETLFWSLENQRSKLGAHPGLIVVDESQSISKTAWSRTIFPMRVRFGKAPCPMIVAGTKPNTDGHWFFQLWEEGFIPGNKRGAMSFTIDTDTSVAFKGPEGRRSLEEARANMSLEDYDSEFDMKKRPGGGGDHYFSGAHIDACVKAYSHKPEDLKGGTLLCYDPALGTKDPAAYIIGDLKGNIILSESIDKLKTDTAQVDEVVGAAKEYNSLVVVESNSTAYMTYTGAWRKLLPYGLKEIPLRAVSTKSMEAKILLCKQFRWQLEKIMVRINPACKTLVKQLKCIRDYKSPSGVLQIRAPEGEHDDEAFAAVIYGEAISRGWSPVLDGSSTSSVSANILL